MRNTATAPRAADMLDQDHLEALIDLHTRSIDTLRGFETMVEKAVPAFRTIAEKFRALHARHVTRLATMVREMGGRPDSDGSFMGTVNRTVVTLRATFDTIDHQVIHQIHSGEAHVLAAFDRALGTRLPQRQIDALSWMRVELAGLLERYPKHN